MSFPFQKNQSDRIRGYIEDIENPPFEQFRYSVPSVSQTPYQVFKQKSAVQNQCSSQCVDLHEQFDTQSKQELKLQEQQKKRLKEKSKELLEHEFKKLTADEKALYLINRAATNLERTLNLSGGLFRNINQDLDDAEEIIIASDLKSLSEQEKSDTRWNIKPSTKEALHSTRADENVHNWAYLTDMSKLVEDMMEREEVYREVIDSFREAQPFDYSVREQLVSHPVLNNLQFASPHASRGLYRSRNYSPELYKTPLTSQPTYSTYSTRSIHPTYF